MPCQDPLHRFRSLSHILPTVDPPQPRSARGFQQGVWWCCCCWWCGKVEITNVSPAVNYDRSNAISANEWTVRHQKAGWGGWRMGSLCSQSDRQAEPIHAIKRRNRLHGDAQIQIFFFFRSTGGAPLHRNTSPGCLWHSCGSLSWRVPPGRLCGSAAPTRRGTQRLGQKGTTHESFLPVCLRR